MSEVKVNKISPRTNCGTVQLGDSGDTITIPAGATITNSGTASGFGATGAASWDTTVKTSGFTAVSGVGYFVNTTSGAITVNLPAGSAGDVVAIKDYAGTFDTNNVTLARNGSDKIGGETTNATLETEGIAVTLVFVDSTQGWLVTDSGLQSDSPTPLYVTATGGTISNSPCGNFKIHKFTGPGTFCVSAAGNSSGSNTIDYLVVAGGGAGGYANGGGGGGGAGGLRYSASTYCNPTPAGGIASTALPVTVTGYPVTVGAGGGAVSGSPDYQRGCSGSNSVFAGSSTITSAGGGGGGAGDTPPTGTAAGNSGGSGGGGGKTGAPACGVGAAGGAGNTPPVSPSQGNSGGIGGVPNPNIGGGGGGHAATGQNGIGPSSDGGDGGNGSVIKIDDTCAAYAGGGGGQAEGQPAPVQGQGGSGGGGSAGQTGSNGNAGSINTGGGGGGADSQPSGQQSGAGGSGIVIIRYKFQN